MGKIDLQRFGGDWTETKLKVLSGYLKAYTTALKRQPFQKIYIDAFAGTGYRELKARPSDSMPLFTELSGDEPQKFLDGSTRIALQTEPAFDTFIFIEAKEERADELRKMRAEFPSRSIDVRVGDANELIQKLCSSTNWKSSRAVLFLDPFGMQVDWKTMEAVASTKAIDTWILFPLGIGINRLLTDDAKNIPAGWRKGLDRVFGTPDWKSAFYNESGATQSLFDLRPPEVVERKQATFEGIGQFYHARLKTIFPAVAPNPKNLVNSSNNPIFQLHFAAGNERGGKIALKIAKHILDHV